MQFDPRKLNAIKHLRLVFRCRDDCPWSGYAALGCQSAQNSSIQLDRDFVGDCMPAECKIVNSDDLGYIGSWHPILSFAHIIRGPTITLYESAAIFAGIAI